MESIAYLSCSLEGHYGLLGFIMSRNSDEEGLTPANCYYAIFRGNARFRVGLKVFLFTDLIFFRKTTGQSELNQNGVTCGRNCVVTGGFASSGKTNSYARRGKALGRRTDWISLQNQQLYPRSLRKQDITMATSETNLESGPVNPNVQHSGGTVYATPYVAPAHGSVGLGERPEKFNGKDFKRWQQKMLFYLTTLNLARFLQEDAPDLGENPDRQTVAAVDAWKQSDFLVAESNEEEQEQIDTEEEHRPSPSFGEWDVNDPGSAEGFIVIHNKARDGRDRYGIGE
ncbi:hypothetical protein RJ639_026659 [Escallonia herrerae]|uniref:RIN4 pathogenic type III effector avirulence factor Avr cleavage site domain-containing protein n=1 Tax=Escallonia herrerae TaxID=1293975 RepID=A0AA88S3E2_9ASTE|nr:hypothetical protein RJ639_026659 [Escallonia herrerae]